jgi:catechol 2,3-dioxygenase-like lactoylglutathione lyase family enzyme
MAINGIDHVNIGTPRLAETCAFFCDVLGFTKGWRPDFPYGGAWLYAGGRAVIHLRELTEAKRPSDEAVLDHVAFAIDDFDDAARRLDAAGLAYRATEVEGSDIRQIFIKDLNGLNIELNFRGAAAASA